VDAGEVSLVGALCAGVLAICTPEKSKRGEGNSQKTIGYLIVFVYVYP